MNWNSRDRFSASIDEHYYGNSSTTTASSPPSREPEKPSDVPQLPPFEIFDPFSTIYEWTETSPLEPKKKSSIEPTAVERVGGDLENCESLFVENSGAESGSFFDPLQTIMDDEEETTARDNDAETDAGSHSEATNAPSNDKATEMLDGIGDGCDTKPSPDLSRMNPGQVEEFVFVDNSDVPPSPPPSPSNNELNLESYCLVSVPGDSDLEKSSKEPSFSDEQESAQTNPFEIVHTSNLVQRGEGEIQSENCQDQDRQKDSESKASSVESVTSSAPSSSLLHSPSPTNSSMDSSVSCEDASSSNSTSLASHDGCDDQTFRGLLVKDKQCSRDDALDNSTVDWLSSTVTIQKPFQLAVGLKIAAESQKVKQEDSSNEQIQSRIHPSSGNTPALLYIDTENSKRSEMKLSPGLRMSEETAIIKDPNGRKKRTFSLVISKSNYTEKVYLKATNPIKNEQTCFSQTSPVSRFGTIMSSFTFGLKKLENIFPRLSLETYNVLNYEKLLEMSSEDYETLRRLRRSAEDAIFFAKSDGHAHDKQGASKALKTADSMKASEKEFFDDPTIGNSFQNSEASLKNSVTTARESMRSFRSARLLRTLSQRLSQHFLSREETAETDHEVQKMFRKEEVFLEFVDECFLDISFCNDRSAANLKLCTKLFVTLFINKPFRLIIALNDRRYELLSGVENIIKEKSNSLAAVQGEESHGKLITIKDANTCGQAMSDYSGKRELVLDDSNIGRKFEAMRVKVFSGAELEVNKLPLSLSAQAKISLSGQIKLNMTLSCRRRCQNILLRFALPDEWLQVFRDSSLLEARNANRRITTVGFNRLQTLLTSRGNVDPNLFEVSCGEAWFHEATGELIWRIEELLDLKDVSRSTFLLLRLNLIGCNDQSPQSEWLGKSEAPPRDFELTNRFVKIAFTVEDCNISNVEPALVRIDRMKGPMKGQRSEDQKYPEVTTSHATRFEYCVEIDVLKGSQG